MLHWLLSQRRRRFPCSVPLVLRALLHIFPTQNCNFFMRGPILALKRNVKRPCALQKLHFSNEKSTYLMKERYVFNGRSCLGLGVVWWRRGAGQERSHAAWRSFFSKTMLPMQRGARSGPRGWRQLPARSAPMQRGARFFQKQCFPCSVALVLGRGGGASGRPGVERS